MNTGKEKTPSTAATMQGRDKKALPPGQKKAGFSRGALLVVFLDILERIPHARAHLETVLPWQA